MKIRPLSLAALMAACQTMAATLVWNDSPAVENVKFYAVYFNPPGNSVLTQTNLHTLTNLEAGLTYSLSVTAINSDGIESPQSDPFLYTAILAQVPTTPVITSQSIATVGTNWLITVSWRPSPPAESVTGYFLGIRQNSLNVTNVFSPGGSNLTLSALVPVFSPTSVFLRASNSFGLSTNIPIATYQQPSRLTTVRLGP